MVRPFDRLRDQAQDTAGSGTTWRGLEPASDVIPMVEKFSNRDPQHVVLRQAPSVSVIVERSCRPRSRTSPQTGSERRTGWRGRTLSLSKRAGVGHVSTSSTCLRAGDPRSPGGRGERDDRVVVRGRSRIGRRADCQCIARICLAADVLPRSGVSLGRTTPPLSGGGRSSAYGGQDRFAPRRSGRGITLSSFPYEKRRAVFGPPFGPCCDLRSYPAEWKALSLLPSRSRK